MVEKWLTQLEELDSFRFTRRLDRRIYEDILMKSEQFTQEKAAEFKDGIELLGRLIQIHADYSHAKSNLFGAWGDMFGDYLTMTEQTNERGGQFFTPMNVADFMIKLGLPDEKEKLEAKIERILDPAAGTGRFMLLTAKHYADKLGKFNFLFYNVDIDFRAFVYCTMNAILNAIPSIQVRGDSLAWKYWEGFVVIPVGSYGLWHHLDEAKITEILGQPPPKEGTLEAFTGAIPAERPTLKRVKATVKVIGKKKTLEEFLGSQPST